MKTRLSPRPAGGRRIAAKRGSPGSERGFAVLAVMILLIIMVALVIGNNIALGQLQTELRLLERRQQMRRESIRANPTAAASIGTSGSSIDRIPLEPTPATNPK